MEAKIGSGTERVITAVIVTLLPFTLAHAGPFGLDMGISLEDLRKVAKVEEHPLSAQTYVVTPPKPHPDLERYLVLITPQHGLCKVLAFSGPISTSVYGTELKSAFERLQEPLSAKYGKGEKYDFLRSGSIWNEPRDWMMGLLKGERKLVWAWEAKQPQDGLVSVWLEAKATGREVGGVSVAYEFTNTPACVAARDKEKNSNL